MNYKKLFTKVHAKKDRAFAKYIPFNTRYRPTAVVPLKTREDEGIRLTALSPPYISRLNLPDHLRKHCSPYRQPVNEVSYPGNYIVQIKDGRILMDTGSNMAIVSATNKLIDKISFQWKADKVLDAGQNIFLRQKGFKTPQRYNGKVFSLLSGGGARTYFYHWVMDSMPKLGLLQQSGLFDEVDFFLAPNYKLPYQRQFLEYFGINEERVIDGANITHLQAYTLIVASYTVIRSHHPQWMCDWLHNSLVPAYDPHPQDKMIYIARGDARRNRKVLNEEEVISLLQSRGFEICYLSNLSVTEQARLFHSASVVVAPHGGGLTNLVFCRPGTRVLELFPETYVSHPFCDISMKRSLDYDFLLCPADGDADCAVDGQKINLTVRMKELQLKVDGITQRAEIP
ncbi:MAG TPA: glycosyltransferase family 61 protein [Chitinophagaceae bacterium]|nr:glycosyltransferase family 61 protein [Chitinophagaceae bacterium]